MNATRRLLLFALPPLMLLAACAAPTPTASPEQVAFATAAPTMAIAATQAAPLEPGVVAPVPAANQMIIKDANLVLTVRDVDQALRLITQLCADNGGYLISTETWVDNEARFANLHLAVPSARFEAALNQFRQLAVKVEHETTSGQDVSAEYTDLRSQLVNLEATAARVRAFLDDAKTVEESLRINAELSRLEGDIERITGQMRYYEGRSAFSTVTLALQPEPAEAAAVAPPVWNPAKTVENASRVAVELAQTAVDVAIWLGFIAGPPAVVLVLAFIVLRLFFRRRSPKPA